MIAIHNRPGSFSEQWILFCQEKKIPYKLVNCYNANIVHQLSDCDVLMWHHLHVSYKDKLFAKQLLFALQQAGKKVFPDFNTGWHFDDKVGQKYLLEAMGAPLVPSYVFYSQKEAWEWISKADFPKVFKLRGGAASTNVKLVRTASEARQLTQKSFGGGFSQFDRWGYLKERFDKWRYGRDSLMGVCKGAVRLFVPTEFARMYSRERGYVYFQDFIPGNSSDTRVVVVGDKSFAFKRLCRENDFRASGSGRSVYNKDQIDKRCIKIAFEISEKLLAQSMAYDFVFKESKPLIVEMSFCWPPSSLAQRGGYWNRSLEWHEGPACPQAWIFENILNLSEQKR